MEWGIVFLIWILGVLGGYWIGRVHEILIRIGASIDNVAVSVERVNKGAK